MVTEQMFSPPKSKRFEFDEPQFTVQRQKYRGVKESHKINLELSQFLFSIRRLYEQNEEYTKQFEENMEFLFEGGEYETPEGMKNAVGLSEISYRINSMLMRIQLLREFLDESGRFSSRFGPRF